MDEKRVKRICNYILEQIDVFGLNLADLTVFTELGTNTYAYVPLICSLANARKVYAITRTSNYGTYENNVTNYNKIIDVLGMKKSVWNIEIVSEKRPEYISRADIVTNLGFVRPITNIDILNMKPTAVIPLMYEAWEYRTEDVDIESCTKNKILVMGVNEETPPMDIMGYGGFLATKLMFECGYGVFKDNVLVLGSGRIGKNIARFLNTNGVCVTHVKSYEKNVLELEKFDVIIVSDLDAPGELIGYNGFISIRELQENNPLVQIIHICGNIDSDAIKRKGFSVYPDDIKPFGYMSATMNNLDYKSTIQLLIGGLKTGEIMAKNRRLLDFKKAYIRSMSNKLIDGFVGGNTY